MPRSDSQLPQVPAGPIGKLRFNQGYRLTLVLEPSGIIRSAFDVSEIGGWEPSMLVGWDLPKLSSFSSAGATRSQEWISRLDRARTQPGRASYTDRLPDSPATSRALVEVVITPIDGVDGALESILVQIEDRTSQYEAEDLVRGQQEQLRNALELTGLGSYALYLREPRMDADERFAEIYGRDPQAVVDEEGIEGYFEMIHAEDRASVREALEAAMSGEIDYVANFRLWSRQPGGPELRWIEALGRVEADEIGPVRVVGVIEDVTARHFEHAARLQLEKREMIGTLAGGVVHDFNNVLSAILSNAGVAEMELAADQSPATSIKEIQAGARRAAEIVRRLLSFSREGAAELAPLDLGPVVQEACALLRPTLPEGITLSPVATAPLPLVVGDATQLHRVVINLVTNAAQAIASHGASSGMISVSLDHQLVEGSRQGAQVLPRGDYLRLLVQDDGPGIAEDLALQIFDPFFTTKPMGEGTGLGLSAVQSIVAEHHGMVAVDSSLGAGAVFTVLLPSISVAQQQRGEADGPAGAPRHHAVPVRVLFVDDEEQLAEVAIRAMPGSGCIATAFTSPEAALAAFEAAPEDFDALVTDLSMPGLDGLQLAAQVRALRPGLPIVLTSGHLTRRTQAQAAQCGVDRIVPKPCSANDLASAVLDLIVERSAAGGAGGAGGRGGADGAGAAEA